MAWNDKPEFIYNYKNLVYNGYDRSKKKLFEKLIRYSLLLRA